MNTVQAFIDVLTAELDAALPDYTVEAREPAEGELRADADVKQVFITTEGIEPGPAVADGGASTQVVVPVMVACVMRRPSDPVLAGKVLRRRLTIVQAVQRAMQALADTGTPTGLTFIQEQPQIVEGFYVSVTGVEVGFDLGAEEPL